MKNLPTIDSLEKVSGGFGLLYLPPRRAYYYAEPAPFVYATPYYYEPVARPIFVGRWR